MPTRLPTFLIIGAPRAATTSMHHWLRQHPDIFMPDFKEPTYFAYGDREEPTGERQQDPYIRSFADYQALFVSAGGAKAVGEASTLYLQVPEAPQRIKSTLDDIKLIVILRDPAERSHSLYQLHRIAGSEPLGTFREALDAERERMEQGWRINFDYRVGGYYARHLKKYYRYFDIKDVLILFFEDVQNRPNDAVRSVCSFLGVDENFPIDTSEKLNASGSPKNRQVYSAVKQVERAIRYAQKRVPSALLQRTATQIHNVATVESPKLSLEDRTLLIDEYRDDILELQRLTGRDLSSWLSVQKTG